MSSRVLTLELISLVAKQARGSPKDEGDKILKQLEEVLDREREKEERLLGLRNLADSYHETN